jgi:hypothetical protein
VQNDIVADAKQIPPLFALVRINVFDRELIFNGRDSVIESDAMLAPVLLGLLGVPLIAVIHRL